ncbi:hypothetical protein [Azospirillum largimobile]
MAITEAQVREGALRALAASSGGFISTEDLIPILQEMLNPTGDDLTILEGRSDTKFSQKVRNLVSHREQSTSLETRGLANYDEELEGWRITNSGRDYVAAQRS